MRKLPPPGASLDAMHWIRRHPTGRPPHPDILTPAEWRVLEHVREGLPNAEIAVRLGVTINTVRTHVSSMLAKLELPDRHALAQWQGQPSEASRHHLERTRFALPLGDWPSLLRFVAGGGAAVVGVFVIWFAIGMAQDGGPRQDGGTAPDVPDLSGGNPPAERELLAAQAVHIGGAEVAVRGERNAELTRVEIELPEDIELVAGPLLLHEGLAIPALHLERTSMTLVATFPITAAGADLHLDLGPVVRVEDGEPVVLTIAVGDAWRRTGIEGNCPMFDHAQFPVEGADVAVGDPAMAVGGSCGWHYRGSRPSDEVLGVTVAGTWHSQHGLMREGNWPDEFSVEHGNHTEVQRATSDPGFPQGEVVAFDQTGESLELSGSIIGYSRGADDRLSWGESRFQFKVDDLTEVERVTLLIGREQVDVIEGDHIVLLQAAQ